MKIKFWKITLGFVFLTVFFANLVQAGDNDLNIRELVKRDFEEISSLFIEATEIPFRFPSYLSGYDWDGATEAQAYYPHIWELRPESYYLSLDGTPDCNGATSCRFITLKAQAVGETALTNLIEEEGRKVTLVDGMTGVYLPSQCGGAGCSDSKLIFDLDGVRYTVGIKGGRANSVIDLGTSMINDPITKSDYD